MKQYLEPYKKWILPYLAFLVIATAISGWTGHSLRQYFDYKEAAMREEQYHLAEEHDVLVEAVSRDYQKNCTYANRLNSSLSSGDRVGYVDSYARRQYEETVTTLKQVEDVVFIKNKCVLNNSSNKDYAVYRNPPVEITVEKPQEKLHRDIKELRWAATKLQHHKSINEEITEELRDNVQLSKIQMLKKLLINPNLTLEEMREPSVRSGIPKRVWVRHKSIYKASVSSDFNMEEPVATA